MSRQSILILCHHPQREQQYILYYLVHKPSKNPKHYWVEAPQQFWSQFLDQKHPDTPWHMKSDERYISMHEKGKLRAIPSTMTGSFQDLYLTPFLWLSMIQNQASHVIRRRTNRVALTFHGEKFISSYEKDNIFNATFANGKFCK